MQSLTLCCDIFRLTFQESLRPVAEIRHNYRPPQMKSHVCPSVCATPVKNTVIQTPSDRKKQIETSRLHGANGHYDDQYHSAGGRSDQRSNFTRLCSAKLRLLALQQRIIAWRVDVLHPVLQIVGVEWLLDLQGNRKSERFCRRKASVWSRPWLCRGFGCEMTAVEDEWSSCPLGTLTADRLLKQHILSRWNFSSNCHFNWIYGERVRGKWERGITAHSSGWERDVQVRQQGKWKQSDKNSQTSWRGQNNIWTFSEQFLSGACLCITHHHDAIWVVVITLPFGC